MVPCYGGLGVVSGNEVSGPAVIRGKGGFLFHGMRVEWSKERDMRVREIAVETGFFSKRLFRLKLSVSGITNWVDGE
jgi:hypothetical protein